MNKQRLEMMRVMMERVVAGSWKPEFDVTAIASEKNTKVTPDFEITKFNLDSWASVTKYDETPGARKLVCGFSACAVGHACFDEEFRKLGWSWEGSAPKFNKSTGIEAAVEFFEITDRQARRLFMPDEYNYANKHRELPAKVREAKMVADRIQQLINTGSI